MLLIAIHHYISMLKPHTDRKKLKRLGKIGSSIEIFLATSLCLISWALPSMVLFILASSFPGQGFYECQVVDYYHSQIFRSSVAGLLSSIFIIMTWCYANLVNRILSADLNFSSSGFCTSDRLNGARTQSNISRLVGNDGFYIRLSRFVPLTFLVGCQPPLCLPSLVSHVTPIMC